MVGVCVLCVEGLVLRSLGIVEFGVELLAPLDDSVEVSDDCAVVLFQGDDVVSSEALPVFDVLEAFAFLQGFQLFFLVEGLNFFGHAAPDGFADLGVLDVSYTGSSSLHLPPLFHELFRSSGELVRSCWLVFSSGCHCCV